jgi:hypothetical protein
MDEGTAPNITRVHDASERASEARFQALASASGGAVYRVSADWSEIRELESSHSRSDGAVPSGAWEGHHIPPDERARIATELRQAIGATRPFELEHRVIREHGALGWSRSRVVPVLGGAGELLEWIAVVTDVTTQRGDADERARLLEDRTLALAAADREHRRLLAVLSNCRSGFMSPRRRVAAWCSTTPPTGPSAESRLAQGEVPSMASTTWAITPRAIRTPAIGS